MAQTHEPPRASDAMALLASVFRLGERVMSRNCLLAWMAYGWIKLLSRCDSKGLWLDDSPWSVQGDVW